MKNSISLKSLFTCIFSIYLMSFADIIEKAITHIKEDSKFSDSMTQLLIGMLFIYLAFFTLLAGIFHNRKETGESINLDTLITRYLSYITLTNCPRHLR